MGLKAPPDLWFVFCCRGLGASEELAARLWDHVRNREAVRWQLNVLRSRAGSLRGATARTHRLGKVLTPAILMAACVSLEPEGQLRSPEIRQVEASILRLTQQGDWLW
jgi:hypothetical protein